MPHFGCLRVVAEEYSMRKNFTCLAVLTIGLATAGLLGASPDPQKVEADKTRVLALENSWNEAEKHNDGQAISALLSPSFAYTDSDGTFMNKKEFLASIST